MGVWRDSAALLVERCRRLHVTNCTILDSDNVGLLLKDVRDSRVADCLIRDDRPERKAAPSLRMVGGSGNVVVNNWCNNGIQIAPDTARATGNLEGK